MRDRAAAAGLDDKAIFETMAVNHMPAIKRFLADVSGHGAASFRPAVVARTMQASALHGDDHGRYQAQGDTAAPERAGVEGPDEAV